jgi:hypothetical protein
LPCNLADAVEVPFSEPGVQRNHMDTARSTDRDLIETTATRLFITLVLIT